MGASHACVQRFLGTSGAFHRNGLRCESWIPCSKYRKLSTFIIPGLVECVSLDLIARTILSAEAPPAPFNSVSKTDETQKLEHVRPHFRTNKHAKFNSPCYLKYVSDSGLICSTKDFVSMRKYVAVRLIIARFCIHRSGANNWLGRWAGGK